MRVSPLRTDSGCLLPCNVPLQGTEVKKISMDDAKKRAFWVGLDGFASHRDLPGLISWLAHFWLLNSDLLKEFESDIIT